MEQISQRFIPEPTRPEWFDRELASMDDSLYVQWNGRERLMEDGGWETAYWELWRQPREREAVWCERKGILVPEERPMAPVLLGPLLDKDGEPLGLDRRVLEYVASCDPKRAGSTPLEGFKRIQQRRRTKLQAEREAVRAKWINETAEKMAQALTRPRIRGDGRTRGMFTGADLIRV